MKTMATAETTAREYRIVSKTTLPMISPRTIAPTSSRDKADNVSFSRIMLGVDEQAIQHLFSYGTLQSESVQLSTFGRKLEGRPDALPSYSVVMIEIADQDFVVASGTAHHRNLRFTGDPSDIVEGSVLSLTAAELRLSDSYEPTGYERIPVQLQSGSTAWVYINSRSR